MSPADVETAIALTVSLCVHFEGIYLSPYLCPAGVPTIGCGSTHYLDGRAVQLTDPPVTRDEAMALCRESIRRRYARSVMELCPGVDMAPRFAALVDFAYNLGSGQLRASTLRRRVNARRWVDVPTELRKWNMARGRVLPGLTLRRAAEAAMV